MKIWLLLPYVQYTQCVNRLLCPLIINIIMITITIIIIITTIIIIITINITKITIIILMFIIIIIVFFLRIFRWIQMLALVFVSPLSLMFLVGLLSAWPQPSTVDLMVQGYTNCKELIFLGVMDSYLFNAWTETIITAVVFPIWLLFWAIPWVDAVAS